MKNATLNIQHTLHVKFNILCVFTLSVAKFDLVFTRLISAGFLDFENDLFLFNDNLDFLDWKGFAVFEQFSLHRRLSRSTDYKIEYLNIDTKIYIIFSIYRYFLLPL